MNSQPVTLYICAVILGAMLGACGASEETSTESAAGDSAAAAQTAVSPDTTAVATTAAAVDSQHMAAKPVVSAQTTRQGFTTKEDTIEVESEQRSHRPEHTAALTVQPHAGAPSSARMHAGWYVQIGAFRHEGNAERARVRFEHRYKKTSAMKVYDEARTLYRVRAGEFATQKEALRFASSLKNKYPGEYSQAWVVRIP